MDPDDDAYAGLSPRARRKRKNRDQMRAARQREKETMERLHGMVERLESQYQTLQQQQQQKVVVKDDPAAAPSAVATTAAYAEALALKAHFQEENFHLKQTLYEKNKLKETLERHVGDCAEPTPDELRVLREEFPEVGAPRPPPPASPEVAAAGQHSAYAPISDNAVWAIVGEVHRLMTPIQQRLLFQNHTAATITVVSASASTGGEPSASDDDVPSNASSASSPPSPPASPTPLPPFCGWDVRHMCEHNDLRFLFTKAFPHVSPFEAMTRMWNNELAMHSYRDTRALSQQTMRVVQQLNDDTYVFERVLVDATTSNREVVSTYLRYRLRTNDGFLIGLATLREGSAGHKQWHGTTEDKTNESDETPRAWASNVGVWTEFVPIVSNAGCSVRITGSTNLDSPKNAHRNVADVIMGLLRWENLNIGPMFALTER